MRQTKIPTAKLVDMLLHRAEEGNGSAQCNLGVMYCSGQGVEQDYVEAAGWFHLAAAQGNTSAQCNLGVMYRNGHGVTRDYAEAANWFRLAADRGVAAAQYNLGVMYSVGVGVREDPVQAAKWLDLAVARAGPERKSSYSEVRKELVSRMTPQQIKEAQRLTRGWKPDHEVEQKQKRRAHSAGSG